MEIQAIMLQPKEKVLDRCFALSYVHEPKKVEDITLFKVRW